MKTYVRAVSREMPSKARDSANPDYDCDALRRVPERTLTPRLTRNRTGVRRGAPPDEEGGEEESEVR